MSKEAKGHGGFCNGAFCFKCVKLEAIRECMAEALAVKATADATGNRGEAFGAHAVWFALEDKLKREVRS